MNPFFKQTRAASQQITTLFDFAWSTVPAFWNLRWQVNGFLLEVPGATQQQLNDRFVSGSQVHGSNLKRACVTTKWADQQSLIAGIILTNALAIYEHWADEILKVVKVKYSGKVLQFPDRAGKVGSECVKLFETSFAKECYAAMGSGGLMKTVGARAGGSGVPFTKRDGLRAYAA